MELVFTFDVVVLQTVFFKQQNYDYPTRILAQLDFTAMRRP